MALLNAFLDEEKVFRTLKLGTPDERRALILDCPENGFKEVVLPLIGSENPGFVVSALGGLVIQYCQGRHPQAGAILAGAAHRLAKEIYDAGGNHGLIPTTLSTYAFQQLNALALQGKWEEILSLAEEYIPYYEALPEKQNLPSIKAVRINALISLNRIDEADEQLKRPDLGGNAVADIELDRLRRKVADLKKKITDIAPVSAAGPGKPGLPAGLPDADPSTPQGFAVLVEAQQRLLRTLTGGGGEQSGFSVRQQVLEATGIFLGKPSSGEIAKSLDTLERAMAWARAHGHDEIVREALWGVYLCHSRSNRPSRAADALLELRGKLEAARKGIKDPVERGGIFAANPHLFGALCEKLHQSGRAAELLEAIEASKGRGVADVLTRDSAEAVEDAGVYGAVRKLPLLAREHAFHYLTYFVDEQCCYAAVVAKDGSILAAPAIPVSKEELRLAAKTSDPREWRKSGGAFDEPGPAADVSERLSPMVAILEDLERRGLVAPGDHLCYSADESFSNVPLHYLLYRGRPLIESFSVSRIHGAMHLDALLSDPSPARPRKFAAFTVPTRQNLAKPNWPAMEKNMRRAANCLGSRLPGLVEEREAATVARVADTELKRSIVHFSTHGIFPDIDKHQNPFFRSGIVLSDGNGLPDEDAIAAGDHACVLSPEKVLALEIDLGGSHVSIGACVSGLSREGLGGDALGMEWACIQAGARSLLATHWYVSAKAAADFFEMFYRLWLDEGKSLAQSHREALRALKAEHPALGAEGWAAFSLTGDWR